MLEPLDLSSAEKRSWIRQIPPEVWIFIFYFLVTVFLTWPLIIRFGSSIYGVPSDNLGALWQFWWSRNFHQFSTSYYLCPMIGFPFGARFFALPMEPIAFYFEWFLLLFFNEIVVYNVITITNFVVAGITMYYLVRYLTGDRQVALFGGFAYLISTNLAFNAMYFLNLAMIQWMPLYILMLLRFMKKPDWKSTLWLAISALLIAGTNVHYMLFTTIFTIVFLTGRLAAKRISLWRAARRQGLHRKIPWLVNKKTFVLALLVILILVIFVAFFYELPLSLMNPPGKWPTSTTPSKLRIEQYIVWNSASPREYILPSIDNPALGRLNRLFGQSRGSFSNSLYIGWSLIILAIIGVIFAIRRSDKENHSMDYMPEITQGNQPLSILADSDEENRFITWGLVLAAIAAFVLSLKPYMYIGSAKIPLPSSLLMILAPWLRWYLRIAIVIVLCITILACFGLQRILDKVKKFYKIALLVSLFVIVTVEMLIVPPFRNVDLSKVPRVFNSLAALPRDSAIAFYPLGEGGLFNTSNLMYYERLFQKPMLNGAPENSDGEALRRTVYNPYNAATPSTLRRFNIDYIVYFKEQMPTTGENRNVAKLPKGLKMVQRFNDKGEFDNAEVYKITADKADFVPLYLGDITVPQLDEGYISARLMFSNGIIRILNFSGKDVRVNLKLPVINNTVSHELTIKNNDKVIWQRRLPADQEDKVEIRDLTIPKKGLDLLLVAEGKALRLPKDEVTLFGTLYATIRLGDLEIMPSESLTSTNRNTPNETLSLISESKYGPGQRRDIPDNPGP